VGGVGDDGVDGGDGGDIGVSVAASFEAVGYHKTLRVVTDSRQNGVGAVPPCPPWFLRGSESFGNGKRNYQTAVFIDVFNVGAPLAGAHCSSVSEMVQRWNEKAGLLKRVLI
jgi:hypothetical protein